MTRSSGTHALVDTIRVPAAVDTAEEEFASPVVCSIWDRVLKEFGLS